MDVPGRPPAASCWVIQQGVNEKSSQTRIDAVSCRLAVDHLQAVLFLTIIAAEKR